MKEIIKRVLKSSMLGKRIYPLIQRNYRIVAIPIKRRRLQRHGADALRNVHAILTGCGVDYYADWGTLLGIIREGGFIRHDDDIDVTIVDSKTDPQALLNVLLDKRFEFIHVLRNEDRILEFSVSWKKLSIDFFFRIPVGRPGKVGIADVYYDPDIKYETPDQNSYKIWLFDESIKTKIVTFKGVEVRIPDKPDEMLEFEYGPEWRSPISNWSAEGLAGRYEAKEDFVIRVTKLDDVMRN